jgi:hypothetical protein
MRLMTEVVRGTSLGVLMKQARLGDQIVVHEGVFRTFRSHLDGAVIGRDDGLYLNGVQKLISGSFFDYQEDRKQNLARRQSSGLRRRN